MRKLLFQSFFRKPLTEPAPALDEPPSNELAALSSAPHGDASAEASRSAKLMPARCNGASWRCMR